MALLTSNRSKERVPDFSGGQNSGDEPSTLSQNQAELIENTIITKTGKAIQREGYERIGDNPDTLISHWTFDNSTSVDDKASNNGSDTSITYVDGKFGKCASFNGSTSIITVSADSTINVTSTGAFRISAWVYVDSDGENDIGAIVDKWSTNVGYKLWVHSESSSTVKVSFTVGYGAGTHALVVTSSTISTGAWHKIDALYNSDESCDIYLDGTLASYSTDTTGSGSVGDDSAVDFNIGNNSATSATFDGEIDDVRFYDGSFTVDDVELKTILGITRFHVGTTYDKVIRAKNTDIQELNSNYKTWDNISGLTSLTAGLTTNFVQAKDLLFILNGTDNVHSINSSLTVTDEGNTNTDPPRTTFGEYASNNRLFLSGSLTQADRDLVWFSDSLDPQTFNRSTNNFAVAQGRGGKITWLKMFKEFELIIYKDSNIYVLDMNGATPLTDWDLKPLSIAIGCPAGRTVQDIGNDHIFLANDGVRLLSRTSFDKLRVGVISTPIQDIIDDINQDAIQNSVGIFENSLYILGVPTGTSTTPNRFMIWDSIAAQRNGDPNSAWTTIPAGTWNFSCLTSFSFGDNKKTVVAGEADAQSYSYKVLSGNTDNGKTVVQNIIGREHTFGEPFVKKIFDPTQFVAETGSDGSYSYSIDVDRTGFVSVGTSGVLAGGLTTPFTTPATTGGSDHSYINERTKFVGKGNSMRVKISNSVYNKRPTFLEYTTFVRPYPGRI